MLRCIQLAKNGLGTTYPNPLVGSVIVHHNKIIGEGWHKQSGLPHAEVNALSSVKNKSLLPEATIYVSLEPCSHFGKTPPCANLIIEKGIRNVVVGSLDPNPKVAGKGIQLLKDAGCNVIVAVLQKECNLLNKRFFTFHNKKRPYIILKWAATNDGFIAPLQKDEKKPVWITHKISRQLVHKWRAEEQAILVGTNTVIQDNPSLTTRDWKGDSPLRIVVDRTMRIPKNASVLDESMKTIIITEKAALNTSHHFFETINFSENMASQICDVIYKFKIQSLIIEGGAKTLQTFIDENLWDEARVFIGESVFKKGTKAPKFERTLFLEEKLKGDSLKIYTND